MNGSSPTPSYGRFKPSSRSSGVVEALWVQECPAKPAAAPTIVIPTGRVELIFHYGDLYERLVAGAYAPMPRCHVVGQQKAPMVLRSTGVTGIVIARFRPWGAFALFGDALNELADRIVDLELIWGRPCLDDLLGRVAAAASQQPRATIVDDFAASRLLPTDVDALSVASVNTINANWGRSRIADIARQFELGRRQFNRRFTRSIGASPKQLSGVLRAQKAITCIRAGHNLHDVVSQCAYADQSHLIHDIVDRCNHRPTDLARLQASDASRYFTTPDISAFCGTTYL